MRQGRRVLHRGPMTYITFTQVTGGDLDGYHAILAALPTTEPEGRLARYAGSTGDTFVVTAVWESKAHSDRFTAELLCPAIRAADLPPPGPNSRDIEYEVAEQFVGPAPARA